MKNDEKLAILWTNSDKETAMKMVFMYAHFSKLKGWWDKVEIIIWGSTAKLSAEDEDIQDELVKLMTEDGIKISACITCAESYGREVTEKLMDLGFDVKSMGPVLTEYIKSGVNILTI